MLDKSINPQNALQIQEAEAKLSQVLGAVQEKNDEVTHPKGSLLDFFLKAPYPELDLDIKRSNDPPRS